MVKQMTTLKQEVTFESGQGSIPYQLYQAQASLLYQD
jgi:hypothetical protein